MKETKILEFKSEITNTFLKTVCAYANYGGGEIRFGVDDDGASIGLLDPEQSCLDIENKINDTIRPQPNYDLKVNEKDKTVTLFVHPGRNKPYTYKSKAYKRNDTATIEVDNLELTRLILEGKNMNYEELPSKEQNLTFHTLKEALEKNLKIQAFNQDILKTLNLYNESEGYNHAAELLSDNNCFPGIDIAKIGESINIIQKRVLLENASILIELEKVVEIYRDYYQYEQIDGIERKKVERIPEMAFRETIANALIHRTWDVPAKIRVMMYDDRIEVSSPGGLPTGLSKEEYLNGSISILRNPILGNVFYRLNIVEILGTGIIRIQQAYQNNMVKPVFKILDNSITVVLPVMNELHFTKDEQIVYEVLSKVKSKSISEIVNATPFGKSKVTGLLKVLEEKNCILIEGNGRGTKYKIK